MFLKKLVFFFKFDFITFQNYYTGYLTIKAKEKKTAPDQNDAWKILIKRHKLMENVHGESGATKLFTFYKENVILITAVNNFFGNNLFFQTDA